MLYRKGEELALKIHAAGNVEDHVHVVASIPPTLAVAECVRQIKGATAFALNHVATPTEPFKWQGGYGALTMGERSLTTVIAYAKNQKRHHQTGKTLPVYEQMVEDEG